MSLWACLGLSGPGGPLLQYHVFDFGQFLLLEALQLVQIVPLLKQAQALLRHLGQTRRESGLLLREGGRERETDIYIERGRWRQRERERKREIERDGDRERER